MPDAVICSPLRTPIGRFGGKLASKSATELAATVIRAVVERSGVDPGRIDEVVLGQCNPSGEAPAIGRVAALDAGLPVRPWPGRPGRPALWLRSAGRPQLPRWQVQGPACSRCRPGRWHRVDEPGRALRDRACGGASGRRHDAARPARPGPGHDRRPVSTYPVPGGMIETAENVRRELRRRRGLSQDALGAASRSSRADRGPWTGGRVRRRGGAGSRRPPPARRPPAPIDRDRRASLDAGTTMEDLGRAAPGDGPGQDPTATVTAGNSRPGRTTARRCLPGYHPRGSPTGCGLGPVPVRLARLGRRRASRPSGPWASAPCPPVASRAGPHSA